MTRTPGVLPETEVKLLDTLRAVEGRALTVPELIKAVGDRHGIRPTRAVVHGALDRLVFRSLVTCLGDNPRCWTAAPIVIEAHR